MSHRHYPGGHSRSRQLPPDPAVGFCQNAIEGFRHHHSSAASRHSPSGRSHSTNAGSRPYACTASTAALGLPKHESGRERQRLSHSQRIERCLESKGSGSEALAFDPATGKLQVIPRQEDNRSDRGVMLNMNRPGSGGFFKVF